MFLTPVSIGLLHDFMDHEHTVCVSKVENHVHEKDLDCELNLYKQPNSFLATFNHTIIQITALNTLESSQYNFLKNHHQLSFSLRGPPISV